MKTNNSFIGWAALLLLSTLNFQLSTYGQGTAFTYQGRLTSGTNAANGTYDLTFSLFSVSSGAGQVGSTYPSPATAVSNGLFTVTLDFGANFPGAVRWLEIGVRTNGGGAYTTLNPRQVLTPSPYAIFATTSGTASNVVNGSVVKSLNGLKDIVTLAAGTNMTITPNGNTLTLAAAGAGGSGIWSVNGNNAYYNAGNVGIGTAAPSGKLTVATSDDTAPGVVFAFDARHALVGTPSAGLGLSYSASTGAGYVTALAPGVAFKDLVLQASTLRFNPSGGTTAFSVLNNGNVGIGTSTPANRLDVVGNVGITGMESFGASTRQMITLYDSGVNSTFGIGVQDGAFYQRCGTGSGFAWFYGGVHNSGQYNPGTGGATLMTLTGTGRLGIGSTTPQARLEVVGVNGGGDALGLVGYQPFLTLLDSNAGYARSRVQGAGGDLFLETHDYTISGNPLNGLIVLKNGTSYVGIGTSSPQAMLDVAGTARVKVLTITGGADVAEPFQMSTEEIPKGSVVVIDKEHPGRLKRSVQAYDKRVAGIISGANGVNPGISLHQEGTLDGGQNVALSGRVYVLADTASGEIEPGDLLTTSDTPGHAMKVTDHARAQGAILGKAMSSLKEGQGMVLVLVTLQ